MIIYGEKVRTSLLGEVVKNLPYRVGNFTYNSVGWDLTRNCFVDEFGGMIDIKRKISRHIVLDESDIIASFLFNGYYDFSFAPETAETIERMKPSEITLCQLKTFYKKSLNVPYPYRINQALYETGWDSLIPPKGYNEISRERFITFAVHLPQAYRGNGQETT